MTRSAAAPRRRERGRFVRMAVGAAMVVVLMVAGAGPAAAEPQSTLSVAPTGEVGAPPTATGSFKGATVLVDVEKIVAVDLSVVPAGPTGGDPVNQNGCAVVSAGACDTAQVSFSWAIGALAYNGPYVVQATARWCDPLLCLSPQSVLATPVEFSLGAEPKAPTELRADAKGDRTVVVSWARNGEPDLQHYALFRKDPGGEFRRVGSEIAQPDSGRPTFTDTSVAATAGGDFVYRVFAVRNGASGDETTTKISKASADRATTVVPLPTTTAVGTDPNAPPSTIAGEGVDISSFLSGQAPALANPSPIFLDLPDTGFGETLPFGVLPGDDEIEPGEEDAVLPDTPRQREIAEFNRSRPLIPVAAGAILLVLAGHIRLLSVRTKSAPEKLPPGTYVARALEAARANQLPTDGARVNGSHIDAGPSDPLRPDPVRPDPVRIDPVPITPVPVAAVRADQTPIGARHVAAAANGGRHRVPTGSDDDVAQLPVWAEFEPVSAIGLLDASTAEADNAGAEAGAGADEDEAADDEDGDGDGEVHDRRRQFARFAPGSPFDRDVDAEPESDHDLDSDHDFEPESESEFEAESESESESESKSESESEFEFEFESESESEFESDFEPDFEPEFEPEFEADLESDQDFEPAPKAGRRPRAAPVAASRPMFVPEPMPVAVTGVAAAAHQPEPPVEPEPESDIALKELYAFDTSSKWFSEPDSEPEPEPELLYGFDDDSQWSGEPEVFVSPRR